jgi:hypothetical protein
LHDGQRGAALYRVKRLALCTDFSEKVISRTGE